MVMRMMLQGKNHSDVPSLLLGSCLVLYISSFYLLPVFSVSYVKLDMG